MGCGQGGGEQGLNGDGAWAAQAHVRGLSWKVCLKHPEGGTWGGFEGGGGEQGVLRRSEEEGACALASWHENEGAWKVGVGVSGGSVTGGCREKRRRPFAEGCQRIVLCCFVLTIETSMVSSSCDGIHSSISNGDSNISHQAWLPLSTSSTSPPCFCPPPSLDSHSHTARTPTCPSPGPASCRPAHPALPPPLRTPPPCRLSPPWLLWVSRSVTGSTSTLSVLEAAVLVGVAAAWQEMGPEAELTTLAESVSGLQEGVGVAMIGEYLLGKGETGMG